MASVAEKIDLSTIDPQLLVELIEQARLNNNGQVVFDDQVFTLPQLEKTAADRGIATTLPESNTLKTDLMGQLEKAKRDAEIQKEFDKVIEDRRNRIIARATARAFHAQELLKGNLPEEEDLEKQLRQVVEKTKTLVEKFEELPVEEKIEKIVQQYTMAEENAPDFREQLVNLQNKIEGEVVNQLPIVEKELEKDPQEKNELQGIEEPVKTNRESEGVVQQSSRSIRPIPTSSSGQGERKSVVTEKETFVYRAGKGLERKGEWHSAQAQKTAEATNKLMAKKFRFQPDVYANNFWQTIKQSWYGFVGGAPLHDENIIDGAANPTNWRPEKGWQSQKNISSTVLPSWLENVANFFGGKTKEKITEAFTSTAVKKGTVIVGEEVAAGVLAKAGTKLVSGPLGWYLIARDLPVVGNILKKLEEIAKYVMGAQVLLQALLPVLVIALVKWFGAQLGTAISTLFTTFGPVTFSFGLFGGSIGAMIGYTVGGPMGLLWGTGIGTGVGGIIGNFVSSVGGVSAVVNGVVGFASSVLPTIGGVLSVAFPGSLFVGTFVVSAGIFTFFVMDPLGSAFINPPMLDKKPPTISVSKTVDGVQVEKIAVGKIVTYQVSVKALNNSVKSVTITDQVYISGKNQKTIPLTTRTVNFDSSSIQTFTETLDLTSYTDSSVINTITVTPNNGDSQTAQAAVIIGNPPTSSFACPILGANQLSTHSLNIPNAHEYEHGSTKYWQLVCWMTQCSTARKYSCGSSEAKIYASSNPNDVARCTLDQISSRMQSSPNHFALNGLTPNSSGYGYAIDVPASSGTMVYLPAIDGNPVTWATTGLSVVDSEDGNGKEVWINGTDNSSNTYSILFEHLSPGSIISGTANVPGAFATVYHDHLHIGLKINGKPVKPEDHLKCGG